MHSSTQRGISLGQKIGHVHHLEKHLVEQVAVCGKKSFLSKESDTKILQSIYFAYEVGIITSYSNRTGAGCLDFFGQIRTPIVLLQLKTISCSAA